MTATQTAPGTDVDEPGGITPEPLLDLDQSDPEQTVRFNGKLYTIKNLSAFGVARQQRLNRDGKEFFRLYNSDEELSETDEQRLTMLLDRMCNDILDAPVSVRRKLTDSHKAGVVLAFTLAPSIRQAARQKVQEQQVEHPTTES